MKDCSWCLWISSEKVYNIRQLRENFDTDVLLGYYKSGVLEKWLIEAEENAVLEKVRNIDRDGDISSQLEFIFGVRPDPKPVKEEPMPEISESVRLALSAISEGYNGIFSSARSSGLMGSFKPTSFRSIHQWEWEYERGSFRKGSFKSGSFRLVKTSFKSSSFSSGSFRPTSGGSFRYFMGDAEITAEEYKRTKINLSSCPLNEHGYGIHRI